MFPVYLCAELTSHLIQKPSHLTQMKVCGDRYHSGELGQIQAIFYRFKSKNNSTQNSEIVYQTAIIKTVHLQLSGWIKKMAKAIKKVAPDEIWLNYHGSIDWLEHFLNDTLVNSLFKLHQLIIHIPVDSVLNKVCEFSHSQKHFLSNSDLIILEEKNRSAYIKFKKQLRKNGIKTPIRQCRKSEDLAAIINAGITRLKASKVIIGIVLFLVGLFFRYNYPLLITWCTAYIGIWLQAVPFLLLGIILSSIIQVFLSPEWIKRVFPKDLKKGIFFGIIGGLFLPVCDCVSIPVFKSLIKKGIPLPAAITFMTAAPIINPIAILSTYYAYGGSIGMVLLRASLGGLCAVIIGLCFKGEQAENVLKEERRTRHLCTCCHHHIKQNENLGLVGKTKHFMETMREEFFETIAYLLIGIGISTFFQIILKPYYGSIQSINTVIGILIMMGLAFILSLCSSSDAVIGKNIGMAFPQMAIMGFLVFGPMLDIKNELLLSAHFTHRFMIKLSIIIFGVCLGVMCIAAYLGVEVRL